MKIGEYETDPRADKLPLMEGEAYAEMVEDVRENGLLYAIWLYKGRILDGRNRLRACLEAGVEPRFEDKSDCEDPISLMKTANLVRRHHAASVRAMVVAGWATLGRGQHIKSATVADQPALSAKQAAELAGVSERTVNAAKVVLEHGDEETKAAVMRGDLSVEKAAERARPPKTKPAPAAPRARDLASIIAAALRDSGCSIKYTNTTSEMAEFRVAYDGRVYKMELTVEAAT